MIAIRLVLIGLRYVAAGLITAGVALLGSLVAYLRK